MKSDIKNIITGANNINKTKIKGNFSKSFFLGCQKVYEKLILYSNIENIVVTVKISNAKKSNFIL